MTNERGATQHADLVLMSPLRQGAQGAGPCRGPVVERPGVRDHRDLSRADGQASPEAWPRGRRPLDRRSDRRGALLGDRLYRRDRLDDPGEAQRDEDGGPLRRDGGPPDGLLVSREYDDLAHPTSARWRILRQCPPSSHGNGELYSPSAKF